MWFSFSGGCLFFFFPDHNVAFKKLVELRYFIWWFSSSSLQKASGLCLPRVAVGRRAQSFQVYSWKDILGHTNFLFWCHQSILLFSPETLSRVLMWTKKYPRMIRVTISTASHRRHGQHCGGSEMLFTVEGVKCSCTYLHAIKFACRLYVFRPRVRTPSPEPLEVVRALVLSCPIFTVWSWGVTVWVA